MTREVHAADRRRAECLGDARRRRAGRHRTRSTATFTQTIVDSKEFVSGDPLQGPETATTVQVKNGKRLTTDGPFAETKEALGGYYVVDVADLDRALELAAEIPGAAHGALAHRGAPGHGAAGLTPAVG